MSEGQFHGGDGTMITQEADGVAVHDGQKKARFLHVRVTDTTKPARPAVNINLPIGVARWGMKMAQTFAPQLKDANLDWDSLMAMIDEGEQGNIVHVEDEEQHKTIDVSVD